MDFNRDRNRTQKCGSYNHEEEPYYEEVDDKEEMINVCILPARPMNDKGEYAGREALDPQSRKNVFLDNVHTPCPPRENLQTRGPAVNRNLKPGRCKTQQRRKAAPVPGTNQPSLRNPSLLTELTKNIAEEVLREPHGRNNRLRKPETVSFDSEDKDPPNNQNALAHQTNERRALDLETHDLNNRSNQSRESKSSIRHHHEWPQTREDIDHQDFVPLEKPRTYCEEDWYVGDCKRTDAEHALHLVNKDGAFLVRDCSACTNSEPLVLAVYHEKKVYNVKIRLIECTGKYALGTGQHSNDMFDSVADIIKFHSLFPIIFISGKSLPGNKFPENCVLTCPITKQDVIRLLE